MATIVVGRGRLLPDSKVRIVGSTSRASAASCDSVQPSATRVIWHSSPVMLSTHSSVGRPVQYKDRIIMQRDRPQGQQMRLRRMSTPVRDVAGSARWRWHCGMEYGGGWARSPHVAQSPTADRTHKLSSLRGGDHPTLNMCPV